MRRLVLLVGATVLLDTMFYAAVTPLLPHYVDRFDLSKAQAGVLIATYGAGALVGALPGGWLVSRIGVKATTLVGVGTLALTSLAFGLAPSAEVLFIARFVQGIGSSSSWAGALAWLIEASPRERRGELIGRALSAALAGGLLGPALGGAAGVVTPAVAFSAVAAAGLALAAWIGATAAPAPRTERVHGALRAAARDPHVRIGSWLVTLPALCFGVIGVLAPLHLDRLGASGLAIGGVFLLAGVIETVIAPVLGRLSDRRGRLLPLRVGLAASAVSVAALTLPGSAWVLALAVVVAGSTLGTFWTPAMALLADGAEHVGLDQGYSFALVSLAWSVGQMAGSAGGGALAGATGDTLPYLVMAALCLMTFMALAGRGAARVRTSEPALAGERAAAR